MITSKNVERNYRVDSMALLGFQCNNSCIGSKARLNECDWMRLVVMVFNATNVTLDKWKK